MINNLTGRYNTLLHRRFAHIATTTTFTEETKNTRIMFESFAAGPKTKCVDGCWMRILSVAAAPTTLDFTAFWV